MYSLVEFRCDEQGVHVYQVSNSYDGPWFPVSTDAVELMQYTSLQDKNGKDGYAGDLVNYHGSFFAIVWDEYYARFQLEPVSGDKRKRVQRMDMLQFGEIVGNIYENVPQSVA